MEPEGLSLHSQAHATCPYPELAPSNPHTHIQVLYDLQTTKEVSNEKNVTEMSRIILRFRTVSFNAYGQPSFRRCPRGKMSQKQFRQFTPK